MLTGSRTFVNSKYHLAVVMIVVFTFCWTYSSAYKMESLSSNDVHFNPNLRCSAKNDENIWRPCKHGGYIQNPDPKYCGDRYVCYVGLNETCNIGDKCIDNAICTVCGICQTCDNRESCSDFNLCPTVSGYSILNLMKRLLRRRLLELNDK